MHYSDFVKIHGSNSKIEELYRKILINHVEDYLEDNNMEGMIFYPMEMFDEIVEGYKPSEIISMLDDDFTSRDSFFMFDKSWEEIHSETYTILYYIETLDFEDVISWYCKEMLIPMENIDSLCEERTLLEIADVLREEEKNF